MRFLICLLGAVLCSLLTHTLAIGAPRDERPNIIVILVDDMGYSGWVGCEYRARTTTIEGLTWASPWGIGSKQT